MALLSEDSILLRSTILVKSAWNGLLYLLPDRYLFKMMK